MNDKLKDIEQAVEHFKQELGKINVDVDDFAVSVSKFEDGVCIALMVKINVTKK